MLHFIKEIEELTAEQRKELRAVLISAFPNPQFLELMVKDELDLSLKSITQGAVNYEIEVSNLVEWAECQGKLPELLEGASRANPGNPKLKKLCKLSWYINYILFFKKEKLQKIITGIESQKINEIARQVIDQHDPNIIIDHYPNFDNYSLDRLIEILLENSLNQENNLLLKWVGYLCQDDQIKPFILEELQDWLKTVAPSFDLSLLKPLTKKQSDLNEKTSYLMVSLDKNQSNNKFLMNAWLLPNENNLKHLIPLDYNEEQKGAECTWDEAPNLLHQFIQKSEPYLKLPFKLVIELFLPYEYLGEEVYRWEIEDEFGDKLRLSRDYIIVIRSSDRFKIIKLQKELYLGWQRWNSIFNSQGNLEDIQKHFEHLDRINNNYNWRTLEINLKKKLGIKIGSLPQSKTEKQELFKAILKGGIPLAIWVGCESLPEFNFGEKLDQLLTTDSLRNLDNLFKAAEEKWLQAYANNYSEEDLGSHLSILCDNLERKPPLGNQPLTPTGQ